MPVLVKANEATAVRRRVYFDLRDATDHVTPKTGEAGGQPQVSANGAAWTNTGIGTLTHIGNGRYYADLTQTLVATAGDAIETRYKSANTLETPGNSVRVVAFDPYDATRLGLAALPDAVAGQTNGLLVLGPNSCSSVAIEASGGDALQLISISPGSNGLACYGNGSGSGIYGQGGVGFGGSNGHGMTLQRGGSGGQDLMLSTATSPTLAAALLDLADGIESGVTLRQALRAIAAALAGKVENSGGRYRAIANPTTTRLDVVDDGGGNRTVNASL